MRPLGVQYLVLPSIRKVLPMWTSKFRFVPLTVAEHNGLEDYIVSPDPEVGRRLGERMEFTRMD